MWRVLVFHLMCGGTKKSGNFIMPSSILLIVLDIAHNIQKFFSSSNVFDIKIYKTTLKRIGSPDNSRKTDR